MGAGVPGILNGREVNVLQTSACFFFFFFFWGGGGGGEGGCSLSPLRLNIFTVGNMGIMICLGQGGLLLVLYGNKEDSPGSSVQYGPLYESIYRPDY